MNIGILQTGHVAEALRAANGDYDVIFPTFLDGHGFRFTNYPVVDGEFPAGADDAEGWLITGSRHGSYEDLPWIPRLETLVREISSKARPLVGICFGHQIIAQALGGKVEKYCGGWAVGRQTYHFDGLGRVDLNAWHQDQVTELPPGAKVIAQNDFCAYPALAYGDTVLTMQPHPEIRRQYLQGLLEVRGPGVVPEDLLKAALVDLDAPVQETLMANMIAEFFKQERTDA